MRRWRRKKIRNQSWSSGGDKQGMDIGILYLSIAFILLMLSAVKDRKKTNQALQASGKIALAVFPLLFLIFILMGVVSAFVSRETIASWLGSGSIVGILIGELVGCFALIQPAAVFPFAGVLRDRGASYGSLFGFVMTAILIGVSTLPLEIKLFGKNFTVVRNVLTFPLEIEFLGWKFAVLRISLIIPFAIVMGLVSQFVLESKQERKKER